MDSTSDGLGRIYAKVPAEDADLFKGYWNQIQLVPQYGVIDDQLALLSCEFKLGDKVYQSASSYSNDGSNEFLANLPPLEFDLKGGTAAKKANSQLEVVDNALDINIPVTNEENKKTFAVIIGNENYERVPKVHYSYCSMRGAFFDCESRSLEEAQRLCENWLVGQDRCYRN